MDRPMTRYATTDDGVSIAYQVVGEGPIDLVFVHAFVSHLEVFWELPAFERFVEGLSSWARVILFDKRGVGLSDRLSVIPTIEARLDDLRAVLDAVGSERTLVVGNNDGGALAALFAATYPERTLGLVLWRGGVRTASAPDYPWGMSEDRFEERLRRRMVIWGDESAGPVASTGLSTDTGAARSSVMIVPPPRPLARSGRFEGSSPDMSERILASDATLDELEASRTFETFYQAEARTLFRRLWLVTGNRAEAEELMQDAFLRVWERWDRVGGMDDPLGYLYRTAMNLFASGTGGPRSPSAGPSGSRHRATTSPTPTIGRSSGTSSPHSRRGNERRSC